MIIKYYEEDGRSVELKTFLKYGDISFDWKRGKVYFWDSEGRIHIIPVQNLQWIGGRH